MPTKWRSCQPSAETFRVLRVHHWSGSRDGLCGFFQSAIETVTVTGPIDTIACPEWSSGSVRNVSEACRTLAVSRSFEGLDHLKGHAIVAQHDAPTVLGFGQRTHYRTEANAQGDSSRIT
jgi:hypothetical protein